MDKVAIFNTQLHTSKIGLIEGFNDLETLCRELHVTMTEVDYNVLKDKKKVAVGDLRTNLIWLEEMSDSEINKVIEYEFNNRQQDIKIEQNGFIN